MTGTFNLNMSKIQQLCEAAHDAAEELKEFENMKTLVDHQEEDIWERHFGVDFCEIPTKLGRSVPGKKV